MGEEAPDADEVSLLLGPFAAFGERNARLSKRRWFDLVVVGVVLERVGL